jgi:hypothetical protein
LNWTANNHWNWNSSEIDIGTNRIEVQVRDGKHADIDGLDDVKSEGFSVNSITTTEISEVFSQVALTLNIKEWGKSDLYIPSAQIEVKDGSGNSFQQITDNNGATIITGDPGNWSFTASAEGYETKSWFQPIVDTSTKDAFLRKIIVLRQS